jgi:hypothetical protein
MLIRTALTALAIAAILGILGPGLDDHSGDYAQLADIEAAQQQASAQERYERAVQQLCGPNAGWMELQDDSAIQCTTKRGTPTRRVALVNQERHHER